MTALYLATKTTNNPISIDTYASHIPKTAPSDVLDLEFLVAQSLGFEFAVWHAHRALWGIWLDLQVCNPSKPVFHTAYHSKNLPDAIHLPMSIYDEALTHVRASRLTDAEFIYTPSQIALAALSSVSPEAATNWTEAKVPADLVDVKLSASALRSTVEAIQWMILSSGQIPDVEAVREVDRRLRICKNPEKVPGTKAYLAKKAEGERLAEEKRARKMEILLNTVAEDPFGEELKNETQRPGLVDYDDDDE